MSRLDTTKSYRLSDRLLLKDDGDELLAFDPDTLSVHQFNSSLARVAKLCDGSFSCEQMVANFVETFGLDDPDAAREVYRALKILWEQSLLETE